MQSEWPQLPACVGGLEERGQRRFLNRPDPEPGALSGPWAETTGCCVPGFSALDNPSSRQQSLEGSDYIGEVKVIRKC